MTNIQISAIIKFHSKLITGTYLPGATTKYNIYHTDDVSLFTVFYISDGKASITLNAKCYRTDTATARAIYKYMLKTRKIHTSCIHRGTGCKSCAYMACNLRTMPAD